MKRNNNGMPPPHGWDIDGPRPLHCPVTCLCSATPLNHSANVAWYNPSETKLMPQAPGTGPSSACHDLDKLLSPHETDLIAPPTYTKFIPKEKAMYSLLGCKESIDKTILLRLSLKQSH